MKLKLLLIITAALFFSCSNNSRSGLSAILNESHLLSQDFNVNINSDTTLVTKNGCVIKIPKGSLQSDSDHVKLEIKEALNMNDIIMAGLTTMSGKQSLSSGGMIYINAADGYKVTLKKELEILVPTKKYNPDMQVFKGAKEADGKIDWVDPTPLPEDSTLVMINAGKALFKANCANCHKVEGDYTGPALGGITERRTKKWIYDFTRNPLKMIYGNAGETRTVDSTKAAEPDLYSGCLANKWAPTMMTAFPQLTDADLDALYSYIKTENDKHPIPTTTNTMDCCDSCALYKKEIMALRDAEYKRDELISSNDDFFELDKTISVPPSDDTTFFSGPPIMNEKNYITPTQVKATYYTIKVEAFGWYNLDFKLQDNSDCKESELFVRIQGAYKLEYNICLVIPGRKIFVEGGKLNDDTQYGFQETNGKIILPQHEPCYVIAFAQYKDKFIYGKASFSSSIKQTISLSVNEVTKEIMFKDFSSMNLDGVDMKINKSKNSDEIRRSDKQIDSLQKYRPKNCKCFVDQIDTEEMAKK